MSVTDGSALNKVSNYGWNVNGDTAEVGKLNKNSTNDYAITDNIDMKVKGTLLPNSDNLKIATKNAKHKQKPLALFDIKFILLLLAFVSSLCGTVVMWFTDIYSSQIFNRLTLANNTAVHLSWRKPPLEPLLCVYIFNYTNSDDFIQKRDPELKMEEVGPICYRESIQRLNITFFPNHTLSYNEQRTHTYDADASAISEDETVIVPSIPLLIAISAKSKLDRISRAFSGFFLTTHTDLFIPLKAKDFLFGYTDNVLENLKAAAKVASKPVPFEKFGVLVKRAGLSKDRLSIRTGQDDLEEMGQVFSMNNITQFKAWSTDECNNVSGSDGLFFKRTDVKNKKEIYLFHKDSCRSLALEYDSRVDVGQGIPANRYLLKPNIFDNTLDENKCYCVTDVCKLGPGVFDISKCAGVPMVVSRPHFLGANITEGYTVTSGLKPDINKHGFHLDIFPPLGLTVRMLMRVQMNVLVTNYGLSNLGPLQDNFILPVVWVEMNSGEVPKKMFSLLYHITYTMRWGELALMWGFILLTIIFAVLVLRYSISKTSANKEILIISKKKKSNSISSNTYIPA